MDDDFEVLSEISNVETISVNLSIREREQLKARFGGRRWRKLKGTALIRFLMGSYTPLNFTGARPTVWAAGK